MRLLKPLGMVLGCELVGISAGLATRDGIETWYRTINKPSFTPPGAVFGPVWTLLYALMGVAVYRVSEAAPAERRLVRLAQAAFVLQLGLNALWSLIFFGQRSPFAALIEIIFLWAAILVTVVAFWRVSRPAAFLMLPYLLWVSFAAVLNLEIWRLNR